MGAKKTKNKPKRSKAKTGPTFAHVSPIIILMATRNLINMVVVGVTSGAVLLTLLAARHL
jgi:branched-subunit amino acid transport protein